MKKRLWPEMILLLLVALLVGVVVPALAQGGGDDGVDGQDYAGRVAAPPFPDGLDWINVPGPLTWEDLRGKVVLLDFWTYGCINCIHIIPDLERLEAEFADELVVIGVHSAKFENEGDTENIRQIVQRYGVEHPVVNDSDFIIWSTWGVQAWPTLMVVDPEGQVFGYHAGEGVYQVVQPIIAGMVEQFDAVGLINREPIEITPETESQPDTLLSFPGKVVADAASGRLFIADSSHNRIIVADLNTYEVLNVIGGPNAGNVDGIYTEARFDKPQGMALSPDGRTLYVADTDNHTLRAIDLEAQTVTTIAGTGRQSTGRPQGGVALETAINSPWDLVLVDRFLYVAMAGPHQLWRYDLEGGTINIHSGSGIEGLADGAHASAQLAQPSGITTDGERLYFADSEASAIRSSDLDPVYGEVRTIVGTGLFDFGDVDGVGREVRLQHPLGVVYVDGLLYVADTYNSKIKIVDLETGEVRSFTGRVEGGYEDGALDEALFDEPGGISYANGLLYVADANNHAIRVIDLAAETVYTVAFPNPEALLLQEDTAVVAAPAGLEVIDLPEQTSPAGEGILTLNIVVPEGYEFNGLAPFSADWHADGEVVQIASENESFRIVEPEMPLTVPVTLNAGSATLSVDLNVYYCEAINENLCFIERLRLNAPVNVDGGGGEPALLVEHTVEPPVSLTPEG